MENNYNVRHLFGKTKITISADNDSSGKDDHVDLCVLKYFPTAGVLEVSPNFTFHRKPYRIEVKSNSFCFRTVRSQPN